jgi:hypothetical protein
MAVSSTETGEGEGAGRDQGGRWQWCRDLATEKNEVFQRFGSATPWAVSPGFSLNTSGNRYSQRSP